MSHAFGERRYYYYQITIFSILTAEKCKSSENTQAQSLHDPPHTITVRHLTLYIVLPPFLNITG